MTIQYGSIHPFLDGFFDLVEALGNLPGGGAQGGDGPGGAIEGVQVGGFGHGQVGFFAPDGFQVG